MPPKRTSASKPRGKGKQHASSPSKPSVSSRIASRQRQAHDDAEIREGFTLFAIGREQLNDAELEEAGEDDEADNQSWIRVIDVRRCLSALNLPRPPQDFFDPNETLVRWNDFRELARTLRDVDAESPGADNAMDDDDDDVDMHDNEYEDELENSAARKGNGKAKGSARGNKGKNRQDTQQAEIDHAYTLFTTPVQHLGRTTDPAGENSTTPAITLADLKRVARELREDVDERVLRMMIEEANGESGAKAWGRGVRRDEFEGVMRRAGVFG